MTSDNTTPEIAYTSQHPIVLDDTGAAQRIAYDEVKGLSGAEAFSINFDVAGAAGESGEILRFGSSLALAVDSSGELILHVETESGTTSLQTSGANLADTAPHVVGIDYADGYLSVTVDETTMGKTEMSPIVVRDTDNSDFYVGSPSNGDNFASKIGSLTIETAGEGSTEGGAGSEKDPVAEGDPAPDNDAGAEEDPVTGGGASEKPEEGGTKSEGGADSPAPGGESPSAEEVVRVADRAELYAALSKADGGETILLESGDYGDLRLRMHSGFDYDYPSEVTIASSDPSNPAIFSGFNIRDASNLSFDSVVFDYNFQAGDAQFIRPFVINGGENISIRNSVFDGDLARGVSQVADGHGWGTGLSIRNANDVTLEGSEVFGFWKGAVLDGIDNLSVRDNDLHSMRMDGLNFVAIQGASIENNYIHDFDRAEGSTDHPDMIQFWTTGSARPTQDVVIRDNTLDIGDGDWTQSIFMRNEEVDNGRAGYEMYYRNIKIEDNVIANGHLHGISVGETDGLVIRSNSVLHSDGRVADGADKQVEIPRINVSDAARNVTVEDNLTSGVAVASGPGRTIKNNVTVQDQDPEASGYYGDEFLSSSLQAGEGGRLFFARTGDLVDDTGAGASGTLASSESSEGLQPEFLIKTIDADASVRIFDATPTLLDGASIGGAASFEWRFSDGTTVTDEVFAAVFSDGASSSVELTVTLPDGTSQSVSRGFEVTGPEILRFGSETGLIIDGGEAIDFPELGNDGINLGESGSVAEIPRKHVVDVVGAEEFSINFTIEGTQEGSSGNIFRLGTSFVGSVRDDGDILINAATGDGTIRFETSGRPVNDGKVHEVDLDLISGVLQIAIDGQTVGKADMTAPLSDDSGHGLYFGSPRGENFEGRLSDFGITVAASDFATTETTDIPELSSLNLLSMG